MDLHTAVGVARTRNASIIYFKLLAKNEHNLKFQNNERVA